MSSLFPGLTCSATFHPLRLVIREKGKNHWHFDELTFSGSISLGLQLQKYLSGNFPFTWKHAPMSYLWIVLKNSCVWQHNCSSQTFQLEAFSRRRASRCFWHSHKSGRNTLQIQFPSFANLVYKPSQPLVKS